MTTRYSPASSTVSRYLPERPSRASADTLPLAVRAPLHHDPRALPARRYRSENLAGERARAEERHRGARRRAPCGDPLDRAGCVPQPEAGADAHVAVQAVPAAAAAEGRVDDPAGRPAPVYADASKPPDAERVAEAARGVRGAPAVVRRGRVPWVPDAADVRERGAALEDVLVVLGVAAGGRVEVGDDHLAVVTEHLAARARDRAVAARLLGAVAAVDLRGGRVVVIEDWVAGVGAERVRACGDRLRLQRLDRPAGRRLESARRRGCSSPARRGSPP